MTISDLGVINAEVKVAEADVLRLVAGQPAVVTLDALLGQRSSGRMVEIGASAARDRNRRRGARVCKVLVRLNLPDPGLRKRRLFHRGSDRDA